MAPKAKVRSDKVLLVEGRDDQQVIYQFCNHYNFNTCECPLFSVEPKDGVESLINNLKFRPRSEDLKVLAAVMDADENLTARWAQVREAIAESGYELPNIPNRKGTIIDSPQLSRPKIGIWLMPDNQVSGMLEDFLLRLASEEDPLLLRANSVVDSIPKAEQLFGDTKLSKAIIHSWLAWQEEPGTPLGLSITRRYLDPTRHPAPDFKKWLEQLFVDN